MSGVKVVAPRTSHRASISIGGWFAVCLLGLIVIVAIIGPIFWSEAAVTVNSAAISQGPSSEHVLGTDGSGRDVLARTLVATRLSVFLAVVATLAGALLGVLLGAIPATIGPRAEAAAGGIVSTWLAFPALMLALLITIMVGPGLWTGVIAIAFTVAPMFARLMQTLSSEVARTEYFAAARMLGVSGLRLATRYVLPNVAEPVIIYVLTSMSGALLALASLSFLGLGVQPPEFDWGRMLSDGLATLYTNPWTALAPGIAIVLAGVAFALTGDAVAAVFRRQGQLSVAHTRVLDAHPVAERSDAIQARGAEQEGSVGDARVRRGPVLVAEHLTVSFPLAGGWVSPARDVSIAVRPGEIVGLVGESGSGKSVTARALAHLVQDPGTVDHDRLEIDGVAIDDLDDRARAKHLRRSVGFVFQDPSASLNPALTIGRQLLEAVDEEIATSRQMTPREVAVDQLSRLQIVDPERLMRQYPQQLSGGMRQRVMVAMARMNEPAVLIADEPTTALDVTVQQHFLLDLVHIARHDDVGVLVVSHDLGALSQIADRILVMYAGRIVEDIPVASLLDGRAKHPYTRGLFEAVPTLGRDRDERLASIPGTPPTPVELTQMAECAFAARCPLVTARCSTRPVLEAIDDGTRFACHHPTSVGDVLSAKEISG